jgi:hypothetical protein
MRQKKELNASKMPKITQITGDLRNSARFLSVQLFIIEGI